MFNSSNTQKTYDKELMVSIRCLTYNHEPYIRQCLEGFVMQKTDFRFEAIVHDDASTDGTADIIREFADKYPDIIKPIFETENQYSKHDGSIRRIMDAHTHGKYVAICEGDDYWIDPLKLQKQVDFLELHPDYSMCFSGSKVIFDKDFAEVDIDAYKNLYAELKERDYSGTELLESWIVPTASIVFRSTINVKQNPSFMFGDIIIILSCVESGKIHCIPEKQVVYRRNINGISSKAQKLSKVINHYQAIADTFGDNYRKTCNQLIINNITSYLLTGRKSEKKDALDVISKQPKILLKVIIASVYMCIDVLINRIVNK